MLRLAEHVFGCADALLAKAANAAISNRTIHLSRPARLAVSQYQELAATGRATSLSPNDLKSRTPGISLGSNSGPYGRHGSMHADRVSHSIPNAMAGVLVKGKVKPQKSTKDRKPTLLP
eukprot:7109850-Prymnesium_polylepis.1